MPTPKRPNGHSSTSQPLPDDSELTDAEVKAMLVEAFGPIDREADARRAQELKERVWKALADPKP